MISGFEAIQSAIATGDLPNLAEELFGELLDHSEARFRTQESYNLDYKHDVPKSFSDARGISIPRLAAGFYNAFGGVIVFGVEDKALRVLNRV